MSQPSSGKSTRGVTRLPLSMGWRFAARSKAGSSSRCRPRSMIAPKDVRRFTGTRMGILCPGKSTRMVKRTKLRRGQPGHILHRRHLGSADARTRPSRGPVHLARSKSMTSQLGLELLESGLGVSATAPGRRSRRVAKSSEARSHKRPPAAGGEAGVLSGDVCTDPRRRCCGPRPLRDTNEAHAERMAWAEIARCSGNLGPS